MGQALYRKYRSKTLSEIIGQEHITQTLQQAIKSGRISHAYLFTGPRGVGKTSIARILAYDINGAQYNDPAYSMDVIEIDAASNNGIEDIRELRDRTYIAPTVAKYKVYIIDEVHMLSKAAFNGLLKTLEEPPQHVVFILATTEADKLPETIISRTQRFQFLPVKSNQVVQHLRYIAKNEGINIEAEAFELIADHGQGSFRDSINLLDQAANYSDLITADSIRALIGIPPQEAITQIVDHLADNEPARIAQQLHDLYGQGYSSNIIAHKISDLVRSELLDNQLTIAPDKALDLLTNLIEVPNSTNGNLLLEIYLLQANKNLRQLPPVQAKVTSSKEEPLINNEIASDIKAKKPISESPQTSPLKSESQPKEAKQPTVSNTHRKPEALPTATNDNQELDWQKVLNILRVEHNTLYGVIRMAELDLSNPGVIKLEFAFAFHHKKVNEPKNKSIILDAIKQTNGMEYIVECSINKDLLAKKTTTEDESSPDIAVISKIFGS